MKLIAIPLILCVSAVTLTAGFKLPRSVFRHDKLEEAAKKAEEDGKALAIYLLERR
ncbi:MAG: hypothetical protein AB8F34_07095 [Akkermansiaceae bacterium]